MVPVRSPEFAVTLLTAVVLVDEEDVEQLNRIVNKEDTSPAPCK